jgi:ribosomal protein S18 acetylase RimI-like enzyme
VSQAFRIEALASTQDRLSFSCGAEPLDRYLRELATQDIKRRVSNCFVALDESGAIAGYYTFAATSLPLTELSPEETRRLPRYALLPAGLIGRLAIDRRFQRRGLGGAMIMDAVVRAARAEPAIFALIVNAKDEAAIAFYQNMQFQRFASQPKSLFLPLATALKALQATTRD